MNIKGFFKYVEIQTKVASIFPVILGMLFAVYRYGKFQWQNALLMIFSLLCVDMATTALNNYMDFKRAHKRQGYGYEVHNALGAGSISPKQGLTIIVVLYGLSIVSGLGLVYLTDWVVLLLGVCSFAVAITYSWGPISISRTPFGEALSGFFMGFVIFFLGAYVSIYDLGLIVLQLCQMRLHLMMDLREVLILFMASVPLMAGISNIMLANNICDLEDDVTNKRFTLPFYIGKEKALFLFGSLYAIGYLSWLLMVGLHLLPYVVAIALLTAIPVYKMVQTFKAHQDKATTFVLAVKSFVIMSGAYVLTLGMGIAIKHFF